MSQFKFVDLFCGIGGFHQALTALGGECVFAADIDRDCNKVYRQNYGIDSAFDITKVSAESIPPHDVLCGGFPCQAFSKAGKQQGINDTRGTLFFDIERILTFHRTRYIILENVRNLISHDNGNTWRIIHKNLRSLGYRLTRDPLVVSPHQLGVPQVRDRVYILGIHDPENVEIPLEINLPPRKMKAENSIYSVIDHDPNPPAYATISEYEERVLNAWDEFYRGIKESVIGFPVWADFFKRPADGDLPGWKAEFIRKNNKLYLNNKPFIDDWLERHDHLSGFAPTHRKFEWQAGGSISSVWEGAIQFRPSGIRVKKADVFPALVAIVQTPIIGKFRRRLTIRECARLQSFSESFIPDSNHQNAYKQFGNSVNVRVIKLLCEELRGAHLIQDLFAKATSDIRIASML